MNVSNELLINLDKLHTTELGLLRIKKNLSLDTDEVVYWCKSKIKSPNATMIRKGKNWYVNIDNCIITVNGYSYTIITAHKKRNKLGRSYTNTSVTEMWPPNVELCRQKLEPLGIEVKQVFNDSELPFEDNTFHMIINRHASFHVKEVKRILKPNGIFITQQVGGKNNEVLSKSLIKDFLPLYADNTLDNNLKALENNFFEILYAKEYFPYLRFKDIGAIVYFAKIIQWEFPNFSVENCFEELCKLNKDINVKGYIESIEHRYIIACRK